MQIRPFVVRRGIRWLHRLGSSFLAHEGPQVASYLAFTSLFAVVPLMAVSFFLLSSLPQLARVPEYLQTWLFSHLLPQSSAVVQAYLETFADQALHLSGISVVMLLVTCLLMVRRIEMAFNTIWGVTEHRGGVKGFVVYWLILLLGPILLSMVFVAATWLASFEWLRRGLSWAFLPQITGSALPVAALAGVMATAYGLMPNTRVRIEHALLGGTVASILFECTRQLTMALLGWFPSYQIIYGAFAAFPVFLLWLELSWMILLIGAEVVAQLGKSQPHCELADPEGE